MPEDTAKTVISPSLETNPRENLAGWTESLQDAARAFCASHGPNGALGLASSAAFWLAVHGGAVVARPVHAPPGPLGPRATKLPHFFLPKPAGNEKILGGPRKNM